LRILDDLVDDGTINMRVRGADGGERAVTLDTGHRSRELTQPGALYRGLGFDYRSLGCPRSSVSSARAALRIALG